MCRKITLIHPLHGPFSVYQKLTFVGHSDLNYLDVEHLRYGGSFHQLSTADFVLKSSHLLHTQFGTTELLYSKGYNNQETKL